MAFITNYTFTITWRIYEGEGIFTMKNLNGQMWFYSLGINWIVKSVSPLYINAVFGSLNTSGLLAKHQMRSLGEAEPGGICPLLRWAIVFDYAAVCLNALMGQNRRGPAINVQSRSLRRVHRGISLWQDAVSSVWFVRDIFTQKQTNMSCVFGVCTVKGFSVIRCFVVCLRNKPMHAVGTYRCRNIVQLSYFTQM